jgi:glycosyltransferase involved in cell wall biosynthesis
MGGLINLRCYAREVSPRRGGTVLVAHPSPDIYGSDRMVAESVRALAGEFPVVVVLPADGPLVPMLTAAGAHVITIHGPVLRKAVLSPLGLVRLGLQAACAFPRYVRVLQRLRPCIVYVNTVTIPLWILAARLARIPVLCHVHEAEQTLNRGGRWLLTLPLRWASAVIANSRSTETVLASSGLPRRRIQIIYNGISSPVSTTPFAASPRLLAVVGRLSPRKGPDIAIKATLELLQRGREVSLDIIGGSFTGYEWYESKLHGLAAGCDAIRFCGEVGVIWPSLAAADIVVIPSYGESFGNVAVEAMLAGRPVVASDIQGLTEVICDGETGVLVPPGDAEALADGIESLLADWERARRLADAGREDARARFGAERYRREIVAAVRGLESGGPIRAMKRAHNERVRRAPHG